MRSRGMLVSFGFKDILMFILRDGEDLYFDDVSNGLKAPSSCSFQ